MTLRRCVVSIALLVTASVPAFAQTATLAVASRGDKAVNLFNVAGGGVSLQLGKSIPLAQSPSEMCLSPDGKRLFASVPAAKHVAVIDVGAKTLVGTLSDSALQSPDGCTVSPDGKTLYEVDQASDAVFAFSVDSKQLLKKITVEKEPRRAVFSPDGKRLIVSNAGSNTLSVIDPTTGAIVKTVKTGNEPRDMAFSPDGKLLAVSIINDDSTAFFNADTLEFRQQSGSAWSPQRMEFAPDSRRLYVVGKLQTVVAVLRIGPLNRLDNVVSIPHGPLGLINAWGLAMTADGRYLYVSNLGDDTLSVIDTQTLQVVRAFPGGKTPVGLVYIKATGGTTGMTMTARFDHYRSLAQAIMEQVKKNDLTTATKTCQTLETEFDEGERDLRQNSPDTWNAIDLAMDDFIMPIMRSGGTPPNTAKLEAAYQNYLAKLKLAVPRTSP